MTHELLVDKYGNKCGYYRDIPETRPEHRLIQLQIKLRGDTDIHTWYANRNAKWGAARQDGRDVGFCFLQEFADMTPAKRWRCFKRNLRIDQDRHKEILS